MILVVFWSVRLSKWKEKYLVDEAGKKAAVVLAIKDYRRLLERLEDLEDAVELDAARRSAKKFRPYSDIRRELREAGQL
jgi:PHD/YefM family antitoxin component YafN of YafNO toxin-antitoxin module